MGKSRLVAVSKHWRIPKQISFFFIRTIFLEYRTKSWDFVEFHILIFLILLDNNVTLLILDSDWSNLSIEDSVLYNNSEPKKKIVKVRDG